MRVFLLLCFLLSARLSKIREFLKEIETLDKQVTYLNDMIKVQKAEIAKIQPLIDMASDTWHEED
ncbi:MAG: hypothetical protein CBC48_09070 [bacterium TMED88]|nr:hypothetical protein [Deltaproteobacteria bacterium]OUV31921.1 MAG: hypothetical protein CBC48_09070 [bacterium TMED88]